MFLCNKSKDKSKFGRLFFGKLTDFVGEWQSEKQTYASQGDL